jgi:UPF0716 protein FxsA
MLWLVVALLVLPLVELWVILQVAGQIGAAATLLCLVAISLLGAWLVKREGLGVWRRLQTQLQQRRSPHIEVVDGFLLLVAGVLLLAPGFITDVVGLLLLLPPVRAVARRPVLSWARRRVQSQRLVVIGNGRSWIDGHDVIDVESEEATDTRPSMRELRP